MNGPGSAPSGKKRHGCRICLRPAPADSRPDTLSGHGGDCPAPPQRAPCGRSTPGRALANQPQPLATREAAVVHRRPGRNWREDRPCWPHRRSAYGRWRAHCGAAIRNCPDASSKPIVESWTYLSRISRVSPALRSIASGPSIVWPLGARRTHRPATLAQQSVFGLDRDSRRPPSKYVPITLKR